jgi:hypothetical protein
MKNAVAILALTTVGLGSASAYLLGELRDARAQTEDLQAQIDELQRLRLRQNPFDRPAPPAEPEPAPVTEQPAAVKPPPVREQAVASAEPPPFMANRQAMMDRSRQLLQDPEYRKAMLAQQKLAMRRMYPDLLTALRLQPQEAERLMDVLAEQQLNMISNQPPFRGRGQPPDPTEVQQYQQQVQQQQRERDAQIAALLGDAKLQEWQQYQKTLGARAQIRELRTELAESGIPLREGQVEPLVSALASEQERRSQEMMKDRARLNALGTTMPAGRVTMMEQDLERAADYNQRLHDAAAPYLSSDQLRRFDAHLNQQLEAQRVNVRMMRAQQDAVARGDIQPNAEVGLRTVQGATFVEGAALPATVVVR